jgi:hypothetical protein
MFSGKYPIAKHNDRYFIDRDGNSFLKMINFLSKSKTNVGNGKSPVFTDKIEESNYYDELEFWQIPFKELCICKFNN